MKEKIMYIAHKCIKCNKGYVDYEFGKNSFECSNCDVVENEETFWRHEKMADYLRDLEGEIENCYPYKEMDILGCTIDLAIGYHIMDRIDARDFCMNSVTEQCNTLNEKWQISYCNFGRVEKYIQRTEDFAKNSTKFQEESLAKHLEKIASAKIIFKEFVNQLKK